MIHFFINAMSFVICYTKFNQQKIFGVCFGKTCGNSGSDPILYTILGVGRVLFYFRKNGLRVYWGLT